MDHTDQDRFTTTLFNLLCKVNPGFERLAMYEFRYCLVNVTPSDGWDSVELISQANIEAQINDLAFFKSIQFKPKKDGKIQLDKTILQLTQVLLVGLVRGVYPLSWVKTHFYFDIRAFVFLVRTDYFTDAIKYHYGGKPFFAFERQQHTLESKQDIGYREFSRTNRDVDQALMDLIEALIAKHKSPLILTLLGPTGAGKTEIIQRMQSFFEAKGLDTGTIEMDNFYKDGSFREGKTLDKTLIHYDLFIQSMHSIRAGKSVSIPRYHFQTTTSSHDLNSMVRPGYQPLWIDPADVIFLEGNYPFHQPDVADLVDIKIIYLTDDDVRLKRKWRRDIDYRKKYDPVYFVNRYFRTQMIRAVEVYHPLMQACDMVVDTSRAVIWLTPELQARLAN